MELSFVQKEAADIFRGPAMVIAGPGSGKTTVIVNRIRNLIEKYGVDPASILVITFTRAAAGEMQRRFLQQAGPERPPVNFGTFHAVFYGILRNTPEFRSSRILQGNEKNELLRELFRQLAPELPAEGDYLEAVFEEISAVKGGSGDPEQYIARCCEPELFRRVYRAYNRELRRGGFLDFDDMTGLAEALLTRQPELLQTWRRRYRYFLVDEFQDISPAQYRVLRLLAAPDNNLFIVGDDDQSIYRFRGAEPGIMLGFPADYPDCRRVLLAENYRSDGAILRDAARLIAHNQKRFDKNLQAVGAEGEPPVYRTFADAAGENAEILRQIGCYTDSGIPLQRIAVLYRTKRTARALTEQLTLHNIPFQMDEALPDLYSHWIARDLLAYLTLAAGRGGRGELLRIINKPSRYVSRAALSDENGGLAAVKRYYRDRPEMLQALNRLERQLGLIGRLNAYGGINLIRRGLGYDEYLKKYAAERNLRADSLIDIAEELQESARDRGSLDQWLTYMEKVKAGRQKKKEAGGLVISTMHRAKGLEYDVVFIPDANEGLTPHSRALDADSLEEERRLFYVAMTRAAKHLHIYHTEERYNRPMARSRFAAEAEGVR